jgi:hypothetical protein
MKNKIFTTIAILLMYVTGAFAQNTFKDGYQSYFGQDSTSINMTHIPCELADICFTLSGVIQTSDTIRIHDKLYYFAPPRSDYPPNHELDYYFPRYDTLFLREEQYSGKLFRYYRNYFGTGEVEKLISDMSLEVGDEIMYPYGSCLHETSLIVYNVYWDNGDKIIQLHSGGYQTEFREGLFPLTFPLWQEPLCEDTSISWASADYSILLCEYKDEEQIYVDPFYGCYGWDPWIVPEESDMDDIMIYPNRIDKNGVITIKTNQTIKSVKTIDMTGRELSLSVIENSDKLWKIKISQFSGCSMCFMIIKTEQGYVYEKIVVID